MRERVNGGTAGHSLSARNPPGPPTPPARRPRGSSVRRSATDARQWRSSLKPPMCCRAQPTTGWPESTGWCWLRWLPTPAWAALLRSPGRPVWKAPASVGVWVDVVGGAEHHASVTEDLRAELQDHPLGIGMLPGGEAKHPQIDIGHRQVDVVVPQLIEVPVYGIRLVDVLDCLVVWEVFAGLHGAARQDTYQASDGREVHDACDAALLRSRHDLRELRCATDLVMRLRLSFGSPVHRAHALISLKVAGSRSPIRDDSSPGL